MVITMVSYLARSDLYRAEKPFKLAFDPPPGVAKKTNHEYVSQVASITDVRGHEKDFSLDTHGFEFHDWPTDLSPHDFNDEDTVRRLYYAEIRQHVLKTFPDTTDIMILNHRKRRRDEEFRQTATREPEFSNPIFFAHTDFSPSCAFQTVKQQLKAQSREDLSGLSFDFVNVWRVVKGPNRDWPLAVCDYSSVSSDDVEFTDIVHRDHVGENIRLYPNDQHRWYFLDKQDVNEVLIFRNVHAEGLGKPFAAHVAFEHPESSPDQHRESVEIRMIRFFKSSQGTCSD